MLVSVVLIIVKESALGKNDSSLLIVFMQKHSDLRLCCRSLQVKHYFIKTTFVDTLICIALKSYHLLHV